MFLPFENANGKEGGGNLIGLVSTPTFWLTQLERYTYQKNNVG